MFLPFLEHLDQIHTYSWDSACFAQLYRDLCRASKPDGKDIGGASVLLQMWAWERLPCLAPHLLHGVVADGLQAIVINEEESLPPEPHGCRWGVEHTLKNTPKGMIVAVRDQLDQLRVDEFIWQPYSADLIGRLPAYCRQGMELWRTRWPLICFDVIEWHFPDRVLRQFGFRQSIPAHCDTEERLHRLDQRGKPETRWPTFHARYLQMWADRAAHVMSGELTGERMSHADPYMVWYRRHSRILIGNPTHRSASEDGYHGSGSSMVLMTRYKTAIHDIAYHYLDTPTDDLLGALHRDMQRICQLSLQTLETIDEVDQLAPIGVPVVASTPRCEPLSTSTHSEPSSSYARSTSVGPSTYVPPPAPRWPSAACTPFPGPSSSSVPPRGRPAASTPVRDLASSFTPSPQVEPST